MCFDSAMSLIVPSLIAVKIKRRIKFILKSAALTFVGHSVTLIIFCQLAITQTSLSISLSTSYANLRHFFFSIGQNQHTPDLR